MDLNTIWFLLIGVLFIGYVILDGFDLGVGILSLFARNDDEHRQHFAAIGPVWDGNEVWLLTAGGALFAAFPIVYKTIFSGFYLAFMLLLAALIFRAVALEFSAQMETPTWKRFWQKAFGIGSFFPALLTGVAFGNILRGVPIDASGHYTGTFLQLLNPFALLVGVLGLVLMIIHGALYLAVKTEDPLRERMQRIAGNAWQLFAILYAVAIGYTAYASPNLWQGLTHARVFYLMPFAVVLAIIAVGLFIRKRQPRVAFLANALVIAGLIGLAGIGLYPNMAPSSLDPAHSLTIYNAASTPKTLTVMLIITLLALPLVLAYTAFIYWVFRGKVQEMDHGY